MAAGHARHKHRFCHKAEHRLLIGQVRRKGAKGPVQYPAWLAGPTSVARLDMVHSSHQRLSLIGPPKALSWCGIRLDAAIVQTIVSAMLLVCISAPRLFGGTCHRGVGGNGRHGTPVLVMRFAQYTGCYDGKMAHITLPVALS